MHEVAILGDHGGTGSAGRRRERLSLLYQYSVLGALLDEGCLYEDPALIRAWKAISFSLAMACLNENLISSFAQSSAMVAAVVHVAMTSCAAANRAAADPSFCVCFAVVINLENG